MKSKYDAKKAANWLFNNPSYIHRTNKQKLEKRTSYKERQELLKTWKKETGGYGQSLHSETHKYLSDEEDKF